MSCGASGNTVDNAPVTAVAVDTRLQQQATNRPKPLITNTSNTMNILIACHTDQQAIGERLQRGLTDQSVSCHVLNEAIPRSLSARANVIRWCNCFVVLVSRLYQRTPYCMEAINYAKDSRKPIIAILVEPSFRPYGALGVLIASALRSIPFTEDGSLIKTLIDASAAAKTQAKKAAKNVVDPTQMRDDESSIVLPPGPHSSPVLICTADDGSAIAQLVYSELVGKNHNVALENYSQPNTSCSVAKCTVFVPILTPQLEQTVACRVAFEQVRRLHKPIVPVIATKDWRPKDWLGLTIASLTFFRIFDKELAYEPFYDSNRMTDLRVEIETACRPIPSEAERETIEMKALQAEIEQCKSKLRNWPPARKPRNINAAAIRQPVRVEISEPRATLRFNHIHHSITRMDIKAPPALVDQYGLPKRRTIDCMISYQWNIQPFVRQVYEDFSMREVRTWFDIWGSMQGSTNEAMATGVESAKVLLVFLSKAYIDSTNCQLEFRYALQRGKAFVILRTEPNISMENWMLNAIQGFPKYDVYSYAHLEQEINGVPMIDVVVQAIRTLAQAQPPDVVDDCSAELFELRSLLDDARDAITAETGQERYKTCTRCGQQFDDYSKDDCKKHRAYYMGGTILEGRWVCCRQQAKDSPGCEICNHTSEPRKFVQDPSYGTWTWVPA